MGGQRLGVERCMMLSPHGAGKIVKGSGNINAMLAQGWTIVANDFRNHLKPERMESKEVVGSTVEENRIFSTEAESVTVEQQAQRGKRPRIKR